MKAESLKVMCSVDGRIVISDLPPPSQETNTLSRLRATLALNTCAAVVAACFSTPSLADIITNDWLNSGKDFPHLSLDEETIVEGINVDVKTVVCWNNYTITTNKT